MILGFASFSPNQDASFQYPSISPNAANDAPQAAGSTQPSSDATVVPKPKKFFKSRNSMPDIDVASVAALAETPVANTAIPSNASASTLRNVAGMQQYPTTSKISIKIKKKTTDAERTRKTKAEKATAKAEKATVKAEKATAKAEKAEKATVKVEKQPRPEKKVKVKKRTKAEEKSTKVVPEVKPTRVLSRARKAVNYSEEKSRSPSPKPEVIAEPPPLPLPLLLPLPLPQPSVQNDLETSPIHQPQFNNDGEPITPIESQAINHFKGSASPPSTSKNLPTDHPPIVLRISKVRAQYHFLFLF